MQKRGVSVGGYVSVAEMGGMCFENGGYVSVVEMGYV